MSLNSNSGSSNHPMTHRAKQQSMNAQRRNKNALKNDSKLNEVDELTEILPHSDNIKDGAHSEILHILNGEKNNMENYILPIKNLLDENIIQRVKKGTYFEIGDILYEVTEMPILDGGEIKARMIVSKNSENISPRHTFTMKEVLHSMIPENQVGRKLIQYIASMERQGGNDNFIISPEIINHLDDRSKYLEYLFMDKQGNPHATMDDVRRANDEIHRMNYSEKIDHLDLLRKIPENPYFIPKIYY